MRACLRHYRRQHVPELEGVGVGHRRVVAGLRVMERGEENERGDAGTDLLAIAVLQVPADLERLLQVGEQVGGLHRREVDQPDGPIALVALEAAIGEDGEVAVLYHFEKLRSEWAEIGTVLGVSEKECVYSLSARICCAVMGLVAKSPSEILSGTWMPTSLLSSPTSLIICG